MQYESLPKSEQRAYDAYRSNRSRLNNQIDTARLDGKAEGIEEGRFEGRSEMRRETALAMKLKGFSSQDISAITGLANDEIERLP